MGDKQDREKKYEGKSVEQLREAAAARGLMVDPSDDETTLRDRLTQQDEAEEQAAAAQDPPA